jgi:hypothetical protein
MHPGLVWQGALQYRAPAEASSPKLKLVGGKQIAHPPKSPVST